MKLKPTVFLATLVVTLGLLLGANAAPAANVKFEDPNNPNQATRIENFGIDSELYTVVFTNTEIVAADIYGAFPGTFDFTNSAAANEAANAVNIELNQAGAHTVGAVGLGASRGYRIGFGSEEVESPPGPKIEAVLFWESETGVAPTWMTNVLGVGSYNTGEAVWAGFIWSGSAPEPVTIGGTVTDLQGSGLVLRNRGDDKSIVADGPFEFPTLMTPDDWYNVTVATQPTDPAQTCSVENGSGQVPEQAVTDVAVTCAAPVLGDVINVAAEGDTIGDTTLSDIMYPAGVAINLYGQVAFGGKFDEGRDAVFTQDQKVVAEGDTIGDTVLEYIYLDIGGVAINHAGLVAFHGGFRNQDTPGTVGAVFTQYGVVAREGDTVAGGTVYDILEMGNVAISNNLNKVAFHGKVEIEEGLGPKTPRAVFTASDGQDTQVVAQVGSTLPDETTVERIHEYGSVAINDFNVVAFHGQTGGVKAVFTTDGETIQVAAKEGDVLEDGTTLKSIYERGGVAINLLGEVAFHGNADDQQGNGVFGVFTQYGVVAKIGDRLPDDSLISEINYLGGVAINIYGDVVFHGMRNSTAVNISDAKAVFTQYGVVAKVGDNLADGTTFYDIIEEAGVAINPYGTEVAFQGRVDDQENASVDAVFVGQAP